MSGAGSWSTFPSRPSLIQPHLFTFNIHLACEQRNLSATMLHATAQDLSHLTIGCATLVDVKDVLEHSCCSNSSADSVRCSGDGPSFCVRNCLQEDTSRQFHLPAIELSYVLAVNLKARVRYWPCCFFAQLPLAILCNTSYRHCWRRRGSDTRPSIRRRLQEPCYRSGCRDNAVPTFLVREWHALNSEPVCGGRSALCTYRMSDVSNAFLRWLLAL